ncbi:MAG TPA: bifunctional 3-(3-hydroxy-phenyl)propionate/3-hydroxycinnamic acid hydroxylase [Streptosporangiaceae bacterium]|jgi:flavoprotein hydroxylase
MAADADVLVVGDGPVGQTLAIMLAEKGWKVTVVDRWPQPYTMSRAVAFDSEAARTLASIGLTRYIETMTEPSGRYCWRNADGKTLLDIEGSQRGWCHWPDSTSMFQPELEQALTARGAQLPSLTVLRGREVVDATDLGDHVRITCAGPGGEQQDLTGRWLVGCDGANSFVRDRIGTAVCDLSFSRDWLICDVVLNEQRAFDPNNLQICDPDRPRTEASAGPGHRRWEFMRLDHETVEEIDAEPAVWRLLGLFGVTPDNATLLRHAVYTFQSRWARRWRAGRMLIAGDAAHVMPPFAGQGMCSGIRDAANLCWKLDLVLRGYGDDALLDTYVVERSRHVQHAIRMSVELGRVICQLDPVAAADRDVVMIGARERGIGAGAPQAPVHPLRGGLLYRGGSQAGPLTGHLVPQARVRRGAVTGLFDEVAQADGCFVLLSREDPSAYLGESAVTFLRSLGVCTVTVVPGDATSGGTALGSTAAAETVADIDGRYLRYLADAGALAVLIRPDYYVFGQISRPEEYALVIDDLREQLAVAALAS